MALVAVAAIARDAGRVGPFVVVHVDHGARSESPSEGRIVATAARAFGCPVVRLQPTREPCERNGGPEASLRSLRYGAIARLAEVLGLRHVVTAHTMDDQIETILMRLFTGSSSVANAGMRARQILSTVNGEIEIIRPLLTVRRDDLEFVLRALRLGHVEDPSNRDLDYRRNRVRHQIIPALTELDAGFGKALIRAVEHARGDGEVVDRLARTIAQLATQEGPCCRKLDREVIADAEPAIASRVVRGAILDLVGDENRELTHERVMAVVEAARRGDPATIEIPYGLIALVDRTSVRVIDPTASAGSDKGCLNR